MKNWVEDRKLFPGCANCCRAYNTMSKKRNEMCFQAWGHELISLRLQEKKIKNQS